MTFLGMKITILTFCDISSFTVPLALLISCTINFDQVTCMVRLVPVLKNCELSEPQKLLTPSLKTIWSNPLFRMPVPPRHPLRIPPAHCIDFCSPFTSCLALAKRANGKWTARVPAAWILHVLFMRAGLSPSHSIWKNKLWPERNSHGCPLWHFHFTRWCAPILPELGVIRVMLEWGEMTWLFCMSIFSRDTSALFPMVCFDMDEQLGRISAYNEQQSSAQKPHLMLHPYKSNRLWFVYYFYSWIKVFFTMHSGIFLEVV